MLTGFILIIYNLVLAFISGLSAYVLIGRLTKNTHSNIHPSILVLFGWVAMAFVVQLSHLFIPVSFSTHVLLWVMNAIVFVLNKEQCTQQFLATKNILQQQKVSWVWIGVLLFAAIINLLGRAGVGDIADYHLQAIQWDEQYKVVPGLGNLRRQLGNNSNWFLLHSLGGLGFLHLKSVYVLNTLLLVVACVYFLPHAQQKNELMKAVILGYIVLMSFRKYVGAVTNDYVITIYILVLFTEWIEHETSTLSSKLYLVLMMMMLPMYKLSAMVVLLVVLWYLWMLIKRKQFGMANLVFIIGVLFYVPWMYTTYLQSGYLVYPIEQTGLFTPDWKMRATTLQYERIINMANERVAGMPTNEVMKLSFTQWFPHWIKNLDVFSKLLLALFFVLPLIHIARLKKEVAHCIKQPIAILLFTIALAIPVWFVNAPATRFVFGYMVFFIAWNAQQLWGERLQQFTFKKYSIALLVIMLLNGAIFIKQYLPISKIMASIITPLPYGTNTMYLHELKKGYIYTPAFNEQCWDAPIPCTSIIEDGLEWRGDSLDEGFRIETK